MSDRDALAYATQIIQAYQHDIAAAIARGDVPEGFCQGVFYRDALPSIERVRQRPAEDEV